MYSNRRIMKNIENKNIPIFRHLEDEDNILENRDGHLLGGQEEVAKDLARKIYEEYLSDDCNAVFIMCSSKKRSYETSDMISSNLKNINPELKVKIVKNNSLREIDQGEIIIPENYETGDNFKGLLLSGGIFFKEVFGADKEGGVDNYSYRYSDPLLQDDGSYKYPELKKYFSEPGESYKEILIRIYEQIIDFSKNINRFNDKIKFVICSHGQTAQIFEDLVEASDLIQKEGATLKQGSLPRICWELFKKRSKQRLDLGEFDSISIDSMFNEEMIDLLKKETEFLKNS